MNSQIHARSSSRQATATPTIHTPTPPTRSSSARPYSPPTASTSHVSTAHVNTQKLNIVNRVAIEGKVKQEQDGAAIKLYLKIGLPIESVSPNQAIPLFPEGNIKVLSSQVHPLDHNTAPYNFSSTLSPMLHKAARALNLPARTAETYSSLFEQNGMSHHNLHLHRSSSVKSSRQRSQDPAPLDEKFTGHILVSQYNVTYILPREFPPRSHADEDEDDAYLSHLHSSATPIHDRRRSVSEKRVLNFMAAIDMWVPYASKPPRSPYSISIPTPRCLHNHVKLRIFTPSTAASSFASLSSAEEDGNGTWDMMCDPHVTRNTGTRLSRMSSYNNFADDESSDSSVAGFSEGCGVQGTFPSTETIRVRWAKPVKTVDVPDIGDGRGRVGVKQSTGDMTCTILGRARDAYAESDSLDGVLMKLQYEGKCTDVWFAGVATQLGMDVGLEAKGSDVFWTPNEEARWIITPGIGCTGWDIPGGSSTFSQPPLAIPETLSSIQVADSKLVRPRYDSASSSTSSLLRAPLPGQNVAEYSFEGSAASSGLSGTVSSPSSDLTSSLQFAGTSLESGTMTASPGAPITLHVDMEKLSGQNVQTQKAFTFSITGTVLVVPRHTTPRLRHKSPLHERLDSSYFDPKESFLDTDPVILPRFTVLVAEQESTTFSIRSGIQDGAANVEVYKPMGDVRDAQTRKTVLKPGGMTKCGDDGGRIALRSLRSLPSSNSDDKLQIPPRLANGLARIPSMTNSPTAPLRPPDCNLVPVIPYARATVTPLFKEDEKSGSVIRYAVTLSLPAMPGLEWLEVGQLRMEPELELINASVEGVSVRFERQVSGEKDSEETFTTRANVGSASGIIVLDYVSRTIAEGNGTLDLPLPFLYLPIGKYEVLVESAFDFTSIHSNMDYRLQSAVGLKFIQHSVEERFTPRLFITRHHTKYVAPIHKRLASNVIALLGKLLPLLLFFAIMFPLLYLSAEVHLLKLSMQSCTSFAGSQHTEPITTFILTTTVTATPTQRGWFAEQSTSSHLSSSVASTSQLTATSVIDIRHNTPVYTPSATTSSISIPTETHNALAIRSIPFTWPWDTDMQPLGEKIIQGLGLLWRTFRKVYHYPLDPP